MTSPLDPYNPFADPVLAAFREQPPPALDPYRSFFVARITSVTNLAGVYYYGFIEQAFSTSTGLPTDASPARTGGFVSGARVNPAVEVNNALVPVGTYVFMRQLGVANGQIYHQFADPTGGGGAPPGPANCSGCGWFASLLSTDCLTATVLSATGRCGGSGSGGSGGGSGSGSSPPPPPPGMALYSCDGGVCDPTGTSTGDPLVTCVAGGCDPPGSGSALPFDLSSTGCGVIAGAGGAPTIFRVGNECSGTVPLPSGWATYDGYTLVGTGDYGGAADTIMTVSIDPATGVVTAAYTTGGRTYFATATVECSGGSVSIFWSFDFEFAPCNGSVLFQLDLT